MRYKLLGRSGLRVSELALGTMTFGEAWGWGASKEESRKIFDRFVEAGGNFVDTASNYTDGQSESFVGTWASLRTSQAQYMEYYDSDGNVTFKEYYNLSSDPWQLTNLNTRTIRHGHAACSRQDLRRFGLSVEAGLRNIP